MSFMLERFSTYQLRGGKISFDSQADSDRHEAPDECHHRIRIRRVDEFTAKMLKTVVGAKRSS